MNSNKVVVEAGAGGARGEKAKGGGVGGEGAPGAGCRTDSGRVGRCREGGEVGVSPVGNAVGAGCNLGSPFSALLAATKCTNDCWKLLDMIILIYLV